MKRSLSLLISLYFTAILIASPTLPVTSAISHPSHIATNDGVNTNKAKIKGTEIERDLKNALAIADSLMKIQGFIESKDNGEYNSLKASVSKTRNLLNSGNINAEIAVKRTNEINFLATKYRKQHLFLLVDSILSITQNGEFNFNDGSNGWNSGDYPEQSRTSLIELATEANIRANNATTLADVSLIIADLNNGFNKLNDSRIDIIYKLPIRFTEEDGLPGENENSDPNSSYIWDTPLLYLNKPTNAIRITVTKATKQDNYAGSGTVIFCLGEFELYNEKGELIPLREDMFQVNSLYTADGGGIPALVDGKRNTWYHTAYSDSHEITPSAGEYSYVQVNLDEPISAFRYRMVGRPHKDYNRAPIDFGITNGETYDPNNIPTHDPYNLQIIEKVTDVSQITDGGYYILYGNYMKFDGDEIVGEGSGFYEGLNLYEHKDPHSCCLFTFEDAGDGKFYLHSLSKNYYIKRPIAYESANSTLFKKEAATFTIQEHESHEDMFYIYYTGLVNDEYNELYGTEAVFPLQDWGYEMGTCPLTSLDDQTELDGLSEWDIYKVSVYNFGSMWLESVLASVNTFGFTPDIIGDNPGEYNGTGIEEFNEAFIAAQALVDTKDINAAKAAADELQNNIEALSTLELNPIVIGGEYYIINTYDAFYQQQQKEMAIFSDANDNADPNIKSENQPYWGILLNEDNDSKEKFVWTIEQGETAGIETYPGDTYVYLKNKATGDYMGTRDNHSVALPMSKTPVLYFFRNAGGTKFNIGSIDAQEDLADKNGTHYALHILDHNDGKASLGHIYLGHYGTEQSRWKLLNAGTT